MAKENKPGGGESINKLDAGKYGIVNDTGKAITSPFDGRTGPASVPVTGDKTKPGDISDQEKQKSVTEALISLNKLNRVQMESLSKLLKKFKMEDDNSDDDSTTDVDEDDDSTTEVDEDDDSTTDVDEDDDSTTEVDEDDDSTTDVDEDDDEDGTAEFPIKKEDIKINMASDAKAIFEGQTLSKQFKKKTNTILESAVRRKVNSIVDTLQEAYSDAVNNGIERGLKRMEKKLNNYLQYVSEDFMKENELAIESGIRTEIAEDFISGFKTLCEEHHINIPVEKYDALEESRRDIKNLEHKLSKLIEENIELKNSTNSALKMEILSTVGEGLADTEKEKLSEICETVDFESKEDFTNKATILKESYFPSKVSKKRNNGDLFTEDEDSTEISGSMSKYTAAISKDLKNE